MDGCYAEYLSENINTRFIFEPVTSDQITNIVNSFKNSSPGMDDLPIKLFKENIFVLANIIAYICNLSLETGVFPKQLMTAFVLCLHKTGDPHLFDNYRAISILVASRILEDLDKKAIQMSIFDIPKHLCTIHLCTLANYYEKCQDSSFIINFLLLYFSSKMFYY